MARERAAVITEDDVREAELCVLDTEIFHPDVIPSVAALIDPSGFLDLNLGDLQRVVLEWYRNGASPDPNRAYADIAILSDKMGFPYWDMTTVATTLGGTGRKTFGQYLEIVVQDSRRRALRGLLQGGITYLDKYRRDGGHKLSTRMTSEMRALFAKSLEDKRELADTRRDIEAMAEALWVESSGVDIPFPNLNKTLGPLMPGEVWGFSGYSGNGKTQTALNICRQWAKADQPAIIFSTEMGKRWHLRTAAIEAGVSQHDCEKRLLDSAGIQRVSDALESMKKWPMVVNTRPSVSPAEIVNLTQEARQNWPGQHVMVVVDHMHRLDYGKSDANREVGNATRLLKNMAVSDTAGGMSVMALFQPRKPEEGGHLYAPVKGHQVRGDYAVFNEVDIHSSVFRVWVKSDQFGRTKVNAEGAPEITKPGADGAKLCDDRTFLLTDKRRTGGESSKPDVLRYDNVTGEVY